MATPSSPAGFVFHDDRTGSAEDRDERRALAADEINRRIIARLQQDGRTPYSTIARELGTSESTVRNRVAQLTRSRILKVIAVVDPVALGYEAYAMVGLTLAVNADPKQVSRRFEQCEQVTYVLFVAGRFDLLVEVITRDHQELSDFLLAQCYNQPDIAGVEPMTALALYKNLLKWGRP